MNFYGFGCVNSVLMQIDSRKWIKNGLLLVLFRVDETNEDGDGNESINKICQKPLRRLLIITY